MSQRNPAFDPFGGGELETAVPTTISQREIFAASQADATAAVAFNEAIELELAGALDEGALVDALTTLAVRHQSLRMNFDARGRFACILKEPRLDYQRVCVASPDELNAQRQRLMAHRFDLQSDVLWRVVVVAYSPQQVHLFMLFHHIVADGWSVAVLLDELERVYNGNLASEPHTLPTPRSFVDYALHESRGLGQDDRAHWLDKFQQLPPALELPLDRPRPAIRTYAAQRFDAHFDRTLIDALTTTGGQHGATLVASFLTVLMMKLQRLTGQPDQVVGMAVAGQLEGEFQSLVGHCVKMLPVRQWVQGSDSFATLVDSVRESVMDAFEHQAFTFAELVRALKPARDPSRIPLIPVVFNIDQAFDGIHLSGLECRFRSLPRVAESFELFFNFLPGKDGLLLETTYNADLFEESTIRRWTDELRDMLEHVTRQPDLPMKNWQLDAAPAPVQGPDRDVITSLPMLLHEALTARGESVSVRCGATALSGAELDARGRRIGAALRSAGVGSGDRVGLYLAREADLLSAVLGVWYAGAAYVPLDPWFPEQRLRTMVADAELKAVLHGEATDGVDDLVSALAADAGDAGTGFDGAWVPVAQALTAEALAAPLPVALSDPAYVIYTSGSTGQPKGVVVGHEAVSNFVTSMLARPGISSNDVLVAVTTLSFDISVLELWCPLLAGGEVVLADRETAIDGEQLKTLLAASGATVLQATPATWRLLLSSGWEGGKDFVALVGGEAFPGELLEPLSQRCGAVWNLYGPTETTVWSSCGRLEVGSPIHIGEPIDNTVFYVLDESQQPVPSGVAGELYIGGLGVAQGYWRRDTLTAGRFMEDPFTGGRMFKTGDQVRWRGDGLLEHLGRLDSQVKIRGYRIELGEVELVLASQPGVEQAVARVISGGNPGDERLVGYYVSSGEESGQNGGQVSSLELRKNLRKVLPDYMVPQQFEAIDSIPLTPNGKVDRQRLPEVAQIYVAPVDSANMTTTETLVADIWQQALGQPVTERNVSFFDLGGHSLIATWVVADLKQALTVNLSLGEFFANPTVAQLAARLDSKAADSPSSALDHQPQRLGDQDHYQLSRGQMRLWYSADLNPGDGAFNLPAAWVLQDVDGTLFCQALDQVLNHHPALRTRIFMGAEDLCQQVTEHQFVTVIDDLSDQAEPLAQALANMRQAVNQEFDLSQAPLVRHALYRISPQELVLFLMPHHIIFDGWSFDIVLKDLDQAYQALLSNNNTDLASPPLSYVEYVAWHNRQLKSPAAADALAFWTAQLSDRTAVSFRRGEDLTRPPVLTAEFALSLKESDELDQWARARGGTLFMLMLTAYYRVLARWSGEADLVIAAPISGRDNQQVKDVVGFFVNTLPFRLPGWQSLPDADLFRRVRDLARDAYSHSLFAPDELSRNLARESGAVNLFDALFMYQDVRNRRTEFGGKPLKQLHLPRGGCESDLDLWVKVTETGVLGAIEYSARHIDDASARHLVSDFRDTLLAMVASDNAPMPETASSHRLIKGPDRDVITSLPMLLHEALTARGESVSVRCGATALSGAELDARGRRIGAALRSAGVGSGDRVGLYLAREADLLSAVLGVWYAGAAYVPLDPWFPEQRLRTMVADAELKAVLHGEATDGVDDLVSALAADAGDAGTGFDGAWVPVAQALTAEALAAPLPVALSDPAYVIYTSGSTGQPKGVVVGHEAVSNFVTSMLARPGISRNDVLVAVTTLSFDISVLELWCPLLAGGEVVLADRETAIDGEQLKTLLAASGATVLQATPATWRLLLSSGWEGGKDFVALVGGEAFPGELLEPLSQRCGAVWNLYGPTETTVWSSCGRLEVGSPIHIGEPINNTIFYVLDESQQPVPSGVAGELYIGGLGVAQGYWRRDTLTAGRFMEDPFTGGRMFKTGDQVRWRGDGLLEHLGRLDSQVKIRGYRIELGEVELVLASQPGVEQAVARVISGGNPGDERLVGYYVSSGEESGQNGGQVSSLELRKNLRKVLPDYMVPQQFEAIDSIPLTPNGKVDRQQLPEVSDRRPGSRSGAPQQSADLTPVEQRIAAIWTELTGTDRGVDASENFFEMGGHSLLAVRAIARIEATLGVRISTRQLVMDPLSAIARYCDEHQPAGVAPDSVEDQLETPKGNFLSKLFGRSE